jgi:hypothetical protein
MKDIENSFINYDQNDLKLNYFYNSLRSASQMSNFGPQRDLMYHKILVSDFVVQNTNSLDDYLQLMKLLKSINHYTISDFVQNLLLNEIINMDGSCIFILQGDNPSGSNNRILNELSSKDRNFKKMIYADQSIEKEKTYVYIDDFVGTGTTIDTIFSNLDIRNRVIICNYILQETLERLEKIGYKVIYLNLATIVDETIKNYLIKRYGHISRESEFSLNTLISEDYNSPNNNFPYLYKKNKKWVNFLNLRSGGNFRSYANRKNYFLNTMYNHVIENECREKLAEFGYRTKTQRRDLFDKILKESNFMVNQRVEIPMNIKGAVIIENSLNSFFSSLKESKNLR